MPTTGTCARPNECDARKLCPGTLLACMRHRFDDGELTVDANGNEIIDFTKLPSVRHG